MGVISTTYFLAAAIAFMEATQVASLLTSAGSSTFLGTDTGAFLQTQDACTNNPPSSVASNGHTCGSFPNLLKFCNKNTYWTNNKFCQKSCWENNLGYAGDDCSTSAPTAQPVVVPTAPPTALPTQPPTLPPTLPPTAPPTAAPVTSVTAAPTAAEGTADCEPGYKCPAVLDIAVSQMQPYTYDGWAAADAHWSQADLDAIKANCNQALIAVDEVRKEGVTYDKSLLKKCKKEVGKYALCTQGSTSELRKCNSKHEELGQATFADRAMGVLNEFSSADATKLATLGAAMQACIGAVSAR